MLSSEVIAKNVFFFCLGSVLLISGGFLLWQSVEITKSSFADSNLLGVSLMMVLYSVLLVSLVNSFGATLPLIFLPAIEVSYADRNRSLPERLVRTFAHKLWIFYRKIIVCVLFFLVSSVIVIIASSPFVVTGLFVYSIVEKIDVMIIVSGAILFSTLIAASCLVAFFCWKKKKSSGVREMTDDLSHFDDA